MPSEPPPPTYPSRRRVLGLALGALLVVGGVAGCSTPAPDVNLVWEGDSQSAPGPGLVTTADAVVDRLHDRFRTTVFAAGGSKVSALVSRAASVDARLMGRANTGNVLVVWAGTNDLGVGRDPATVHRELATYLQARRKAGWAVVLLTALPRSFAVDAPGYEARRQTFNQLIRDHAHEDADVVVDVGRDATIGEAGDELDAKLYLPDHLHLTTPGRERVARLVAPALTPLGVQ